MYNKHIELQEGEQEGERREQQDLVRMAETHPGEQYAYVIRDQKVVSGWIQGATRLVIWTVSSKGYIDFILIYHAGRIRRDANNILHE